MENNIDFQYTINNPDNINCIFELNASGTVWGSIDGDINNQTDLINLLNTKVDLTDFEELSQTVTNNYNELSGDIADLTTTVTDNYNTLSGQISDLTGVVNDNYTSLDNRLTTAEGSILDLTDTVNNINALIPAQATTSNQLADKDFVNSSIATNTANFIGTFNSISDLEAYSGTVTNNDYAFVINSVITDNGNDWATFADLDNYNKDLLTNFDYAWVINGLNFDLYRYDIVNQEWVLRVSNVAKTDVTLNTAYNRYKATVSNNIVSWNYEYTLNNSSFTASQWASINSGITSDDVTLIGTALQPNDNISELVNDVEYITSSALSGYATENFVTSQGYITGITSNDVTTALGYIPYNSTNPNGYITASALNGYATKSWVGQQGYITNSVNNLTNYYTKTEIDNTIGDIETALHNINSGGN